MGDLRPVRQVAFVAAGHVELLSRALAPPGPSEIQVAVTRTLISAGTELDYLHAVIPGRLRPDVTFPVYPGYSSVGRVVAAGQEVTGVAVGERVLTMGPHADYQNVAAETVVRVPTPISDDVAALAVLGSVALHGLRRAPPELGDAVLVVGDGLVGQLTARLVGLQGGRPMALVGRHQLRLDAARRDGVAATWDGRTIDVPAAFQKLTGGRLADIVYETAGQVDALVLAFEAARVGGRVVLLGGLRQTLSLEPECFYLQFMMKELTLVAASQPVRPERESSYFYWTQRRNRELILRLIAEGALHVEPLITHCLPADEARRAYQLLAESRESTLGVLLDWT
ncbi:MAG: zinc-binding dehydrogenase [Ardenticatenaceae bacterium]|nr:zinc-binding dehydrogenase [Ardenticatenaceae bacterium]HBY93364.1 hypothetical protein [Chloroflexota bacterium]